MEIWKDAIGYEGIYQVSSLGRIRSIDRVVERKNPGKATRICNQSGKMLTPAINPGTRKGVLPRKEVMLSKNGKVKRTQLHRLIALTFFECDNSLEVNHIDGNTLNNAIDNLEMVTRLENIRHAFKNKLINTSYSVIKKDPITKEVLVEYYSVSEAARTIPISQGSLSFHLEKHIQTPYKGYIWEYK